MTQRIDAQMVASISELKANPMRVVASAKGKPLAILNRNKPEFYYIPAKLYEKWLDMLDDMELARLVREREGEPEIEVSLDDL